jgi:hypothetical protein
LLRPHQSSVLPRLTTEDPRLSNEPGSLNALAVFDSN